MPDDWDVAAIDQLFIRSLEPPGIPVRFTNAQLPILGVQTTPGSHSRNHLSRVTALSGHLSCPPKLGPDLGVKLS